MALREIRLPLKEPFRISSGEVRERRIVLLEDDTTMALDVLSSGVRPGDLVRYRYHVRPEDLHLVDEDAVRRALISAGAHEVKLEPVLVHEARVRSTEIATARDTWDRVRAFWAAKGIAIDDATAERVRRKLEEIETAERAGQEVAA